MSYDTIFRLANAFALISWIVLLIFPFRTFTNRLLIGFSVTILCIAYSILVYQILQPSDIAKFNTLDGVTKLLSNPGAALAGWIHYLAFDLMTGLYIVNNAGKHAIGYAWVLPCLIFTFMLGPLGLLLYFLFRWALTKYYFASNY